MERMSQYRQATCFMYRADCICKVHVGRDGGRHPQRQDVPITATDFYTGYHIKGIKMGAFICPQCRIESIMICNSDCGQMRSLVTHKIEQRANGGFAIAGVCVHV